MIKLADTGISPADLEQLTAFANDIAADDARRLAAVLPQAARQARARAGHWDVTQPASVIDVAISAGDPIVKTRSALTPLRKAAVARLALDHFAIEDALPPSIMALYPAFWSRLTTFLRRMRDSYDDDFFSKDVRYALGLTVPCGPLQIDLKSQVGPKIILRDLPKSRSLRTAIGYIAAQGWGRWYQDHLDLREMEEFHAAGWTSCFQRLAELLILNPSVRGVIGASWFYDPCIPAISPELAYVQTPMRFGALRADMGGGEHHTQNAIARSAVRRQLVEEGKYHPTCFLMAWRRRDLIRWSRQLRSNPDFAFAGPKT